MSVIFCSDDYICIVHYSWRNIHLLTNSRSSPNVLGSLYTSSLCPCLKSVSILNLYVDWYQPVPVVYQCGIARDGFLLTNVWVGVAIHLGNSNLFLDEAPPFTFYYCHTSSSSLARLWLRSDQVRDSLWHETLHMGQNATNVSPSSLMTWRNWNYCQKCVNNMRPDLCETGI